MKSRGRSIAVRTGEEPGLPHVPGTAHVDSACSVASPDAKLHLRATESTTTTVRFFVHPNSNLFHTVGALHSFGAVDVMHARVHTCTGGCSLVRRRVVCSSFGPTKRGRRKDQLPTARICQLCLDSPGRLCADTRTFWWELHESRTQSSTHPCASTHAGHGPKILRF